LARLNRQQTFVVVSSRVGVHDGRSVPHSTSTRRTGICALCGKQRPARHQHEQRRHPGEAAHRNLCGKNKTRAQQSNPAPVWPRLREHCRRNVNLSQQLPVDRCCERSRKGREGSVAKIRPLGKPQPHKSAKRRSGSPQAAAQVMTRLTSRTRTGQRTGSAARGRPWCRHRLAFQRWPDSSP